MISPYDIAGIRLENQQISGGKFRSPAALVGYMGALQAQHYNMVKYGIGLRMQGITKLQVNNALNNGHLIRTHVLRPTWHIAASADIDRLLRLTAPRILAAMRSRHRQLGLTPDMLKTCFSVLKKSLDGHTGKQRGELLKDLQKAGIETNGDNRAAHILILAELHQLICSGREDGKQNTYALYSSRVKAISDESREELLAWLADKYLHSHGPATVEDFSWWSGLSMTEAGSAIEAIAGKYDTAVMKEKTYFFCKGSDRIQPDKDKACLIPAFDEFVISYKDRSAIFEQKDIRKAISSNGIFWPVILVGRQVTGLWKPVEKKNVLHIETTLFRRHTAKEKIMIREAASRTGAFYGKPAEVVF